MAASYQDIVNSINNIAGQVGRINPGGTTFTATTAGSVPMSGGGALNFLRSDGVWGPPQETLMQPVVAFSSFSPQSSVTSSANQTMAGMGQISTPFIATPLVTGRIFVQFGGSIINTLCSTSAFTPVSAVMYSNSGPAPAYQSSRPSLPPLMGPLGVYGVSTGWLMVPISYCALATGLNLGVPYWFDFGMWTTTSSIGQTLIWSGPSFTAIEV